MSVLFGRSTAAVGATKAHRQSPWLTFSQSKRITVIRFSVNYIHEHYMQRTTHIQLEKLDTAEEDGLQSYFEKAADLYLSQPQPEQKPENSGLKIFTELAEAALIRRAYTICRGSRKQMAKMLRMNAETLDKKESYKNLRKAEK